MSTHCSLEKQKLTFILCAFINRGTRERDRYTWSEGKHKGDSFKGIDVFYYDERGCGEKRHLRENFILIALYTNASWVVSRT